MGRFWVTSGLKRKRLAGVPTAFKRPNRSSCQKNNKKKGYKRKKKHKTPSRGYEHVLNLTSALDMRVAPHHTPVVGGEGDERHVNIHDSNIGHLRELLKSTAVPSKHNYCLGFKNLVSLTYPRNLLVDTYSGDLAHPPLHYGTGNFEEEINA